MRFSLILATLGRTTELVSFLESLKNQGTTDLELIVVDQNTDDRLLAILAQYACLFPVIHLHSEKGLSKARNVGLAYVTGDIVAFPDDDCEYPPGCLAYVREQLEAHQTWAGITGRTITREGQAGIGRFDAKAGQIDKYNVWQRGISFAIFLRSKAVADLKFDEAFGVGARWGSGEETDFLLRMLNKGMTLFYDPSVQVIHPTLPAGYPPELARKMYGYGIGMGKVLQKHRYPWWFNAKVLIRPFGGSLLSLCKLNVAKAKYHWRIFTGRWVGLFGPS